MSACQQCGTVAKPTDKFCNVCGTPLARAGSPLAPPTPAYGAPPPPYPPPPAPPPGNPGGYPPPPQFGAPSPGAPPSRCQMGHDIAPGASYCPQGHPIALDQMQFASDAYGPAGGFGTPPPHPGFPPPMAPPPYGAAPSPPAAPPYGAAPSPPAAPPYGAAPSPPAAPPYGAPPGYPPPPPFGAPQAPPFGGPPPGYPGASGPPGFPPLAGGFGSAPAAPPLYAATTESRETVPPKILRGFLIAYATNPLGDFWPLTGGRITVGRLGGGSDGVDITLQDPTISSRHAALTVDAPSGVIVVEDTGSTNGTFVNDEHIGFNGRRELRDGDRLRFGGFTAVVKVIGRI